MSSSTNTAIRSALVVQPNTLRSSSPNSAQETQPRPRGVKICDHCHKPGHIKAYCYELHGRPNRGRGRGGGRFGRGREDSSNQPASSQDNFAQIDISDQIHALNCSNFSPWVVDSGASNHMTGSFRDFVSYIPCSGRDKVRFADGSFILISGKGSIKCTSELSLSSVLHVPRFSINLLSINAITNYLDCAVTFFKTHCVFQEPKTGRKLGIGIMRNGLYYLEGGVSGGYSETSLTVSSSQKEDLLLQHRRLGHLSFTLLARIFPTIFETYKEKLVCDACELAKYTRSTYPNSGRRSKAMFEVVHSDVWGPCGTTAISESITHSPVSRSSSPVPTVSSSTTNGNSPVPPIHFTLDNDDLNVSIALRKPTRHAGIPTRLKDGVGYKHDITNFVSYESLSPSYQSFIASLSSVSIPENWKVAKKNPKWKAAMLEEMQALEKNNTWKLVPLPAARCKERFSSWRTSGGSIYECSSRICYCLNSGQRDDSEEIAHLKAQLAQAFEVKDLGHLRYFLGIEVARSSKGIFLSQRKYILDLLTKTGHLIYLSHTRPDIAFAVSVVSQFMHDPHSVHMDAVIRILRYLKSRPDRGLLYSCHGNLRVECYTDADWVGSLDDRRSTSGYCTFVGGNLVTWRNKKQNVVARSTAEAEFRAMAHGVCEILWLRILLLELDLYQSSPLMLYCDNKAAINIANNPVQHDRTKHIEIDRYFIKEKLDARIIFISEGVAEDDADDEAVFQKLPSYRSKPD
ncbi:uncharacterized protein [Elaeis guineensis]|uniref:uncharacterized protein n=1 Tax=Elaeis guineensis var. tenera TaxID=51953 RepID=UPI003C6DB5DA